MNTNTNTILLPEPALENKDTRISEGVLESRFLWIVEFVELNGWGPTYREMGAGWGVTHAAAKHSLAKMQAEHWLTQGEGARQIKVNAVKAAEVRAKRGDHHDQEAIKD